MELEQIIKDLRNNNIEKFDNEFIKDIETYKKDLIDNLKNNISLKELYLLCDDFDEEELNNISEIFKCNNSLTKLYLYDGNYYNINKFIDNLKYNNSLIELEISSFKLKENINDLYEYIENNNKLNKLILYDNEIKDIEYLCEILKDNNTIMFIDLSTNRINNINNLNCLKYNSTLTDLNLTDNELYDLNGLKE